MTPQNQERIRFLMNQIEALQMAMAAAQSEIDGIHSRQWEEDYDAMMRNEPKGEPREPWGEPRQPWEFEGEEWKN